MGKYSDESHRLRNVVVPLLSTMTSGAKFSAAGGDASFHIGAGQLDDCAVLDFHGEVSFVIGSDYVRGPKFALYEQGILNEYDLGFYLVMANVSDIAAMGALPIGLLTIVRYPLDLSDDQFELIMKGIRDAAQLCNAVIVGGDIGEAERVILAATAFGICEKGKYLLRSQARDGDLICVTGPVGTPGAAVAYYRSRGEIGQKLPVEIEEELIASWKRPEARVQEGLLLSKHGFAHACQDISDGLKATIEEITERSGKGSIIDETAIPIEVSVGEVARLLKVDVTSLALSASVDFELLFTIGESDLKGCEGVFASAGKRFYVIGRITDDHQNLLRKADGKITALPGVAWRHQSSDVALAVVDKLREQR